MKDLYSVVEGVLDIDYVDAAEDQMKKVAKWGGPGLYNISMSAQFIADKFVERFHCKWQKTSNKNKFGRFQLNEWATTIPFQKYYNDEISYDDISNILLEATHIPTHIQLSEEDFHMWIEDYVDENEGYVYPCLRAHYVDKNGKLVYGTVFFMSTKNEGDTDITISVNSKSIK